MGLKGSRVGVGDLELYKNWDGRAPKRKIFSVGLGHSRTRKDMR